MKIWLCYQNFECKIIKNAVYIELKYTYGVFCHFKPILTILGWMVFTKKAICAIFHDIYIKRTLGERRYTYNTFNFDETSYNLFLGYILTISKG